MLLRSLCRLLVPLLGCWLLSGCSGVAYLAGNGYEQWKLFNRAQPIDRVLASPLTPEATRKAIAVVRAAKQFAVTELGLHATRNYETYVALDGPCVVWAVSASQPLELVEKKWHFPIVGDIPYLGFFHKEQADAEAARLRKEEQPVPDTWVRCVPAFSSLGWFADPLYSSMLNGKDWDIANVVIHESLHATVWVGDSVDFNEKLANFVGLEGSERFVKERYGSEALTHVQDEVAGEKLFAFFLKDEIAQYKSRVKTLEQKRAFYAGFEDRYAAFLQAKQGAGEKFTPMPVKLNSWNNAALLQYANYYSDYSVLERMLKLCGADLARFVRWIVREQARGDAKFKATPEAYLDALSAAEACPG